MEAILESDREIIVRNEACLREMASQTAAGGTQTPLPLPVYPEAWRKFNEKGELFHDGIVYRMTLPEFLNYADLDRRKLGSYSGDNNPRGDYGGKALPTWKDAMHKARYGWPEKTELCHKLTAEIDNRMRSNAPKIEQTYEVFGGVPDVGRYLSGEPENMLHRQETEAKISPSSRIVKVMLDVNANAMGKSEEQATARGSVAMAAIDAIERTGRRAEVWISSGFAHHGFARGANVLFEAQIKAANAPLDFDAMAFFTCCKDTEKRFMFQVAMNAGFGGSFGGIEACDIKPGDLYIGYFPDLAPNAVACMEKVLSVLKESGMDLLA